MTDTFPLVSYRARNTHNFLFPLLLCYSATLLPTSRYNYVVWEMLHGRMSGRTRPTLSSAFSNILLLHSNNSEAVVRSLAPSSSPADLIMFLPPSFLPPPPFPPSASNHLRAHDSYERRTRRNERLPRLNPSLPRLYIHISPSFLLHAHEEEA